MEVVKEESNGSGKPKIRKPPRSSIKPKSKILADTASFASKRGNPASNVSKSVSALKVSGKDKSAKAPRRFSVPPKSRSPVPAPTRTTAPISKTRTKREQEKNQKLVPDLSTPANKKKFTVLSSASYWLSHIKVSEAATKHSISLGFFKLALESGCEPLQKMRDELKSYAHRHNLVGLGEPLKELLINYNIPEDMQLLQASESCSKVPEEATQTSEGVHNFSITGSKKLKPKSMNENVRTLSVTESPKKVSSQKLSADKNRGSVDKNAMKPNTAGFDEQKKSQRLTAQVAKMEKAKSQEENVCDKDPVEPLPSGESEQDNKENQDTEQPGVICSTEEAM